MSGLVAGSSLLGAPLAPPADVCVVVPARNEQARIVHCLAALMRQHGTGGADVRVLVVADGCTDATVLRATKFAVATRGLVSVISTPARGVGPARRLGMELAARLLSPGGVILTTDADTVAPPDWIASTLRAIGHGARVVAGDVRLDPAEVLGLHPAALADRDRAARHRLEALRRLRHPYGTVLDHGHFAGSSLAITRDTYVAAGGLPAVDTLEDVALGRQLGELGVPTVRSSLVSVTTSARLDSRARHGLGDRLRGAAVHRLP